MGVSIGNKSKHPVSYAGEGEILGPFLVQLGTAQTQLFAVDRPLGNSLRSRDPEAGLVLQAGMEQRQPGCNGAELRWGSRNPLERHGLRRVLQSPQGKLSWVA